MNGLLFMKSNQTKQKLVKYTQFVYFKTVSKFIVIKWKLVKEFWCISNGPCYSVKIFHYSAKLLYSRFFVKTILISLKNLIDLKNKVFN